jgi:hypothetical protein
MSRSFFGHKATSKSTNDDNALEKAARMVEDFLEARRSALAGSGSGRAFRQRDCA